MALVPLQFGGGDKYYYTNTNFIILGLLIEALSGMSYQEYINANVLDPIGMTHTRPNNVPPPVIPDLALGYAHVLVADDPEATECISFDNPPTNCSSGPPAGIRCREIPVDNLRLPAQSFSAGWLISTQTDMAKLEKALHDRSSIMLLPESYEEMWTNTELNDGRFELFGLGWDVCSELDNEHGCPTASDPLNSGTNMDKVVDNPAGDEGKVVSKNGGVAGYSSIMLRYFDDGITVIIFNNIFVGMPKTEGLPEYHPIDLAAELAKTIRDSE